MRLLAALAAGAAAFYGVGALTGRRAVAIRLRRPRRRQTLGDQLHQAGVDLSAAQFRAVQVGAGVLALLGVWAASGAVSVAVVPAAVVAALPRGVVARRRAKRLGAVSESWPDAIRYLIASIDAHRSLPPALSDLAAGGPEAIREVMGGWDARVEAAGVEAALARLRSDLADPVSDRVTEMLGVAYRVGTTMATQILAEQAVELEEDLRTAAEVRTLVLEPRLTARVAFVLPWVGLVLLCATMPEFRAFYTGGAGFVVCGIAGALGLAGLGMARRLSRESPEPRVLG